MRVIGVRKAENDYDWVILVEQGWWLWKKVVKYVGSGTVWHRRDGRASTRMEGYLSSFLARHKIGAGFNPVAHKVKF